MKISHTPQKPSAFPAAKSLILKFAGISINVSATFTSKGEGGFYNACSHTLLVYYSLLKQKGLLVLVCTAWSSLQSPFVMTQSLSLAVNLSGLKLKNSRRISKFNVVFRSL